jgi:RNA polymerase sigma-70 factor (ECF subfamily)
MSEEPSFADFIRQLRAGDERAWQELVRHYEPALRRLVRFRLDPRLRRLFDSADICQSVLASFFVRAGLGQFEVDTPQQLLNLLVTMTRNKLSKQAHKQQAGRRDYRRLEAGGLQAGQVPTPGPDPGQQAAAQELFHRVRSRLTPDEWQLVELRNQGCSWAEVAAAMGGSPDALRMKLNRLVKRMTEELGLEEADHE